MKRTLLLAVSAVLIFSFHPADARIKLTALPDRQAMDAKLTPGQPTLIEEERVLSLQQGTNHVDFSWKGVFIDTDSIRIRMLAHPEKAALINVSYPPGENALTWRIYCQTALAERVRISYLLYHIDSLVAYQALANTEETRMDLKIYAVLRNFSGEALTATDFKLGFGPKLHSGLAHEETKRVLLAATENIPIEKEFTFDARELPWDPERADKNIGIPLRYVFSNTAAHGLGAFTLDPGKVRLFQADGHGSRIFLGEDAIRQPIYSGGPVKLYVGDSRDIVVTQRVIDRRKINLRRNNKNRVILYDLKETLSVRVENFKDKACRLRLVEYIDGEWEMLKTPASYEKITNEQIVFSLALSPREKKNISITYLKKHLEK